MGLLYPGAEDVEFVQILKSQGYGQLQGCGDNPRPFRQPNMVV